MLRKRGKSIPMYLALSALVMATGMRVAISADGRIEINQVSVEAAGGFPFQINTPGSYLLTSNLSVSDSSTTAILVNTGAAGAILDLNGFTISGVTTCDRVDVGGGDLDTTCNDTGTGHGIDVRATYVTVRNGVIRGMGQHGITDGLGGPRNHVEDVTVTENGFGGISLSTQARVMNCQSFRNGQTGIQVGSASIVVNNISAENGVFGLIARGVVTGNTAKDNDENGIHAVGHSVVTQNVAIDNESAGLSLSNQTGYFGNTMNNNGTEVVAGVNLGQNMCGGAICP